MLYKVNSNSNYCLFSKLPSALYRVRHTQARQQRVECPNLQGISSRPRFVCGMTIPTLCLTPKRRMVLRVQSTVCCFHMLCFYQFSVALVLVGLRKIFFSNFAFPTWVCAAGFNNHNNNKNSVIWASRCINSQQARHRLHLIVVQTCILLH